jgi:N-acetylmuramoyl-L-alanine amidase
MQRIALCSIALLVGLWGCVTPSKPTVTPLPPPPVVIRPPQPVVPIPPPVRPAPSAPAWSAPRSWYPWGGIERGRWTTIVVHHSDSDKSTPKGMDSWHRQRGWQNGLGYDFVIGNGVNYPDGQVYVGPRWTRQQTGAHCKSTAGRYFGHYCASNYFNEHGIGICLIGDFESSRPTAQQLEALDRLIAFLCQQCHISPDRVYGHREVTHKTLCPGRYCNMDSIRHSAHLAVARLNRATAASFSGN